MQKVCISQLCGLHDTDSCVDLKRFSSAEIFCDLCLVTSHWASLIVKIVLLKGTFQDIYF